MNHKKKVVLLIIVIVTLWAGLPFIKSTVRYGGPMLWYGVKARQTAAKRLLAGISNGQKSFLLKNGTFTLGLSMMSVEFDKGSDYLVAFAPSCLRKFSPGGPEFLPVKQQLSSQMQARLSEVNAYLQSIPESECVDPRTGFKAYAVGILWPTFNLDVWVVDQNRKFINLQSGL